MIKKLNINWYCSLLCLIKLSIISNADYIIIVYVKKLLPILDLLIKFNYISYYKILNKKNLIIYFFNNTAVNYSYQYDYSLKIMYKNSNYRYINVYNLNKFYKFDHKRILFLSTSQGIITHQEAIKYNIGGKIIFILY